MGAKAIRYKTTALFLRTGIGDGKIEGKKYDIALSVSNGAIIVNMGEKTVAFPPSCLVCAAYEIMQGKNKVTIEVEEKEGSIKK